MSTYRWIESEVPPGLGIRQVYGFVFNRDGRILVLEDGGIYNLPGGKPKIDESISETLIREAEEEAQITINSLSYLGYQLITSVEEFAQVRMFALIGQIRSSAVDPGTGRQYKRLWVPPTHSNDLLKWGESGNQQIACASAVASNLARSSG